MQQAWRSIGYLLIGVLTGPAALVVLGVLAASAPVTYVTSVPVSRAMQVATRVAVADRRRAGMLLGMPPAQLAAEPEPPLRRTVGWLAIHALTGLPLALVVWAASGLAGVGLLVPLLWWALPAGESFDFIVSVTSWTQALTWPLLFAAVAAAVLWWGVPLAARAQSGACRALLAPSTTALLTARVRELATTRAAALDEHAAELRRIERDLHDGAQARLVAIAIQLGVAQRERTDTPQLADQLIEKARTGVEDALVELRGVARGVYPPILADRGLPGAVRALVADCPVSLHLSVQPLGRLPAATEAAAYFVIAEALANIAKHSTAAGGAVDLGLADEHLVLTVTDDGIGGADEHRGTGLAGIRRRVAALDGQVNVTSPAGGPTTLRAELPCAW